MTICLLELDCVDFLSPVGEGSFIELPDFFSPRYTVSSFSKFIYDKESRNELEFFL